MSSTGPLTQSVDHPSCPNFGKCDLLEYDDAHCAELAKCCVGIHDFGDHNKCLSAVRKCRNFGTTWEPRRPMKPLDYSDIQTDLPGYATTGNLVEGFSVGGSLPDLQCIVTNFIAGLIVCFVANHFLKIGWNNKSCMTAAALYTLLRCVLNVL